MRLLDSIYTEAQNEVVRKDVVRFLQSDALPLFQAAFKEFVVSASTFCQSDRFSDSEPPGSLMGTPGVPRPDSCHWDSSVNQPTHTGVS